MKIFISIRVPRGNPPAEHLVTALGEVVRSRGHIAFIAYQEIAQRALTPEQFMPYVRQEISTSDIVLVVYSPDLRGGLIELGIAYALGVPVWLAVRRGEPVSSSALACAERIINYTTVEELVSGLHTAISGGISL